MSTVSPVTATSTASPAYPRGVDLVPDQDTYLLDEHTLYGGTPSRVLRLSPAGREAWHELTSGPVRSPAGAKLARRLTDAGLLHPRPPATRASLDATVLVPVRDRAQALARCLNALRSTHPVVVVDDGSDDPAAVARVCADHGARLVRRDHNGGPAAARNSGLAEITSEFVLLLDSDCVPPPDLMDALGRHMIDPAVGAVAGRTVAQHGPESAAARYGTVASCLDLGDRPARVSRGGRIGYVPTTNLLVRRAAMSAIGGFDEALRYGEDVDLVWRLDAAGWRVRYDPAVTVAHAEPGTWHSLLVRRFRYGTSAGPLARRHVGALSPGVVHVWSAMAVAGLFLRRPWLVLLGWAAGVRGARRVAVQARLDPTAAPRTATRAVLRTVLLAGHLLTQFALPVLLLPRLPRALRVQLVALVIVAPLAAWRRHRPDVHPLVFTAARIADDAAYGAGVVTGAVRERTTGPLRPTLTTRLLGADLARATRAHRTPHTVLDSERELRA